LGAFLIGAVVAESRLIHKIEDLIEPIRDMFSAVFFVAIGLLIDPKVLLGYWVPIVVITLAVVVGKVISCAFGAFVGGNDTRVSLRVGMGLAQIGEFSFIIASLGLTLNVTSKFLYPIAVAVSAITTLLTPYLIKSADWVVNEFDRLAPRSLADGLNIYTRWVGRLSKRPSSLATRLTRRWFAQMALNAVLIGAIFAVAGYVAQHPPEWPSRYELKGTWLKAALWLIAVFFSLPMVIATSRKLQALGQLIAETNVTEASAGARTAAIRAVVAQVVPIIGTVVLGIYIIVLSSALLPSVKVFFGLLLITAVLSLALRRSFIKVYSNAQFALQETLSKPAEPQPGQGQPVIPSLLRDANVELVKIPADSPAAGKLIRELQLRTQTGASIIGIERGGESLINPGPDEELRATDQVLLLGNRAQLALARKTLEKVLVTAQ